MHLCKLDDSIVEIRGCLVLFIGTGNVRFPYTCVTVDTTRKFTENYSISSPEVKETLLFLMTRKLNILHSLYNTVQYKHNIIAHCL